MRTLYTPLICALLAAPLSAQVPTSPAQPSAGEQRLAELERRLEALSRELETQKTGTAMPVVGETGQFGMGPGASKVYAMPSGFSVGGYGEFLYEAKGADLQNGTRVGSEKRVDALRLVLYTGYKFTDRIVFNSELEFEHGGYIDDKPAGEVIVEFAYLDFLLNKAFNVRAGMVLLPMGFINELHEPPAFLGARRPQVERTLIPATWHENGVGLHGDLPGHLSYRLYLVNGLDASNFGASGIRGGRQAGKEANAQSLAWTGRLDWTPQPGILLGTSFYSGNSQQSGSGEALTTTLWDAHGEYRVRGLQLRGLYTRMTNSAAGVQDLPFADPARAVGTQQWGGYLEAGYDLLRGDQQSFIPYVRWERLNAQAEVIGGVVATGAQDQRILSVGAAFKPIPQVVVKLDFTQAENRARTGRDQVSLALGYTF